MRVEQFSDPLAFFFWGTLMEHAGYLKPDPWDELYLAKFDEGGSVRPGWDYQAWTLQRMGYRKVTDMRLIRRSGCYQPKAA
jgi:hypothetical protein